MLPRTPRGACPLRLAWPSHALPAFLACVFLAFACLRAGSAAAKYGERQVAELVEIAASEKETEERRARAVRLLENTDVRTHLSLLRRLLREERSLDIRVAAACTLAALGDRKAPRDLLLATAYDGKRTPNCSRGTVLIALAKIGDPAAEMHLERALRAPAPEDEPLLHAEACRALGILDTPGARKLLIRLLLEASPEIRFSAIHPLCAVAADRKASESAEARRAILLAARADPDEKVAAQATSALFWNGVDGPAFYRLLETDPDPRVRARAAHAMNRHYLTPARLRRLRGALDRERDPQVRAAIEETLRGQKPPG